MGSIFGRTHPRPTDPPAPKVHDLDVQVSDEHGGIANATLKILDGENAGPHKSTGPDGRVLLTSLKQSGFTICASAPGHDTACAGITLTRSQDVTIRLPIVTPPVVIPTGSGSAQMHGRLHVDGRAMRYPDGSRYVWRGITSFALLEMVAHGREAEAVAWMQAARALGFTLVRVLAMNHGWLDLTPEDGRAALPRLLELAAACDAYVLVVALAGTKDRNSDFLEEQVHAIGAICGNHENGLVEQSNEPFHGSQNVSLYSPVTMAKLRAMVPPHVPVTYGSPEKDEPLDSATKHEGFYTDGRYMSGGNFVVIHLDRRPDPWDRLRRFTEVAKVASATGKYTVDDEGKGYAETATTASGNSREIRPEVAYAHGVLARGFNLGATFHCEDGLLCKPLGPVQTACAAEFIAGTRIVSDDVSFVFANAKAANSAVKDASLIGPTNPNAAMLRAFSFFAQGHNLLALVGLRPGADPAVQFQHGWKKTGVLAERNGFAVWQIDV